jgi:hypothetical protein
MLLENLTTAESETKRVENDRMRQPMPTLGPALIEEEVYVNQGFRFSDKQLVRNLCF